jgi:phenylacetate-CoA ligase
LDDQIKTADGRHHVALDFIFYGMENLAEAQIVQDRLDHILLVVVPTGPFGLPDIEVLKRRAHERLGRSGMVDVEVVKEIPRTKAGKFRGIICKV